jgi:hypothetical protein
MNMIYEEADGQLLFEDLLYIEFGGLPEECRIELDARSTARQKARQEARERDQRLSMAKAYSAPPPMAGVWNGRWRPRSISGGGGFGDGISTRYRTHPTTKGGDAP